MSKETLINYYFVVPAQAGIQKNQIVIDSRLRGNDVGQSIPRLLQILIRIPEQVRNDDDGSLYYV